MAEITFLNRIYIPATITRIYSTVTDMENDTPLDTPVPPATVVPDFQLPENLYREVLTLLPTPAFWKMISLSPTVWTQLTTDIDQSAIAANTVHRTSDGKDHSDVGLNNTHRAIVTGNPHSVTKSDVSLGNVDNIQQMPLSYLDTDGTLSADSDVRVASQKAAKTYIDTIVNAAIRLQSDWDADTNSPDITGTTTTGFAWRVSVDGSTDLGGITVWLIGDLAVKTDTGWMKINSADIAAVWGNISGTLSNQTDLQAALDTLSADDFWDRDGTVISPKTAGDDVATTGIFDSQGYKFSFDTPVENFNTFSARGSFPITAQWHDMAYSPSLNRLVVVGWGEILYSDDQGESWTDTETLLEGIMRGIAWSPTLNLFALTNSANIWTSPDGITWTVRETGSGLGTSMDWFPHLSLFVTPSYWSSDGISWTASTVAATSYTGSVYMPNFGKIVGVAESAPHAVYTTSDGKTWANIGTVDPAIPDGLMRGAISYSETLNRLIVGVAFSNTDNAYSDDGGVNWITTGESSGFHTYAIEWSPDHNLFFVSTNSGTKSSPDGLTWTSLVSDITGDKEPSLYERTLKRWFIGASNGSGFWATDEMHPLFDGDILQRDSNGDVKANPLVRLSDTGVLTGLVEINDGTLATTQAPLNNSKELSTTEYTDAAAAVVTAKILWELVGGELATIGDRDIVMSGLIQSPGFFGDFTGTIATSTTGVTQALADNSTLIATTAYADASQHAATEHNIFTSADLDALADAGTITLSGNLTLRIHVSLTSDVIYTQTAFSNLTIHIEDGVIYTYSGTGNFFSGDGNLRTYGGTLLASSTGILFNMASSSSFVVQEFSHTQFIGWNSGSMDRASLFFRDGSAIVSPTDSLVLTNLGILRIIDLGLFEGAGLSKSIVRIESVLTRDEESPQVVISNITGRLASTTSLLDIRPAVDGFLITDISAVFIEGDGTLFNEAATTGVFTAVVDASIGATTINNVTPSGGLARFEWIAGPTVYVGQQVEPSGFVAAENLHYNGTHLASSVGVGWFEVSTIPFGSDEAGSFLSNSVTLTETGTALSDGQSVSLDTALSTAYDIGSFVYNKQTNSFQVNAVWSATETGKWSTESFNQDNPFVEVSNSGSAQSSINFAYSHIEKNGEETSISEADVYQDMDLTGSTGAITAFATNGAGGTTVTSAGHPLVENQNIEQEGSTNYNDLFRVFNITTDTFDIPIAFVADDATGTWFSRILESEATKRFKVIDLVTNEIKFTGKKFTGLVTYIISVKKTGSSDDYLFSLAKNGAIPTHIPFGERTVTTALGSLSVSIPVELVTGDTVKPQLAGVDTTSSMTVQNLITSIQ